MPSLKRRLSDESEKVDMTDEIRETERKIEHMGMKFSNLTTDTQKSLEKRQIF